MPHSTQSGRNQKYMEVQGKNLRDVPKQKRTYCAPPYPGKSILKSHLIDGRSFVLAFDARKDDPAAGAIERSAVCGLSESARFCSIIRCILCALFCLFFDMLYFSLLPNTVPRMKTSSQVFST